MDLLQEAQSGETIRSTGERTSRSPVPGPDTSASIPATRLLSWNRLDLAFKLHLLDSLADHRLARGDARGEGHQPHENGDEDQEAAAEHEPRVDRLSTLELRRG